MRTGVATCDEAGSLARPLMVLRRQPTRAKDYADIAALVQREQAVGVLVGLPLDDSANDSRQSGQARWVRRYAGRLAAALRVPVAFWDETLTTADAQRLMLDGGTRAPLDAVAAALMLAEFLEARRQRRSRSGETQVSELGLKDNS